MLVLSRERDQVIEIQDSEGALIGTIEIVAIRGSKVRVGLSFPTSFRIHRQEVADEIRRSQPSHIETGGTR